uniref:Uncharacterized protein n=1 Tax=viral metagenome TaxID=1070528 RepID=A0A6C0JEX2_9ZZZZ
MPRSKQYLSGDDSNSEGSSVRNYRCSRCSRCSRCPTKRSTYNCSHNCDHDHHRCPKNNTCNEYRRSKHSHHYECPCESKKKEKKTCKEEKTIVITIN